MSTPLDPGQLARLVAAVTAQLGPQAVGEGFPNPVAQLFQAGNTVLIDPSGLFIYAGTPAPGNLLFAAAPAGGTDAYGNVYAAGLQATQGVISGTTVEGSYVIVGVGGGTLWQTVTLTSPGLFYYYDPGPPYPPYPQLVFSATAGAGGDQWGNTWQGGCTFVGLPGTSANTLSVVDTSGDVLAAIDSYGNVTTTGTVSAGVDVTIGGNSVAAALAGAPAGVVARGWTPGSSTSPWPSAGVASTTPVAILELDFTAAAGRDYMLQVLSSTVLFSSSPASNAQYVQRLYYTTDGSTPTTSSTELSGHSPGVQPVLPSFTANYPTPYMEWLIPIPSVSTVYRFLLAAYCTVAATFKYANAMEMRVSDMGVNTGQFGNSGVSFGTGGSGGGGGTQTYTDTFYPSGTYSYYSNSGLRDTNGNMFHGAYSGEAPNYQYSYIAWQAAGSGGRSLAAIKAGYTINWARIRLTNLHTWYSAGMTWGLHTSASLGGGAGTYSAILNPGGTPVSQGATTSWGLSSAQWNAMFAANTYTVLAPDTGDQTNLSWYGYFYGGGGSTSYMPQITVNYTG